MLNLIPCHVIACSCAHRVCAACYGEGSRQPAGGNIFTFVPCKMRGPNVHYLSPRGAQSPIGLLRSMSAIQLMRVQGEPGAGVGRKMGDKIQYATGYTPSLIPLWFNPQHYSCFIPADFSHHQLIITCGESRGHCRACCTSCVSSSGPAMHNSSLVFLPPKTCVAKTLVLRP